MGSGGCDGGRRRPAPRPCPGFPRERERRWGVWWDALARGVRVRVGARSRGRAVREPPLRPGWAHEGGGDAGAAGGRGAPSTGSGRTDLGSARAVGSGGCDGGRRRPAPRPCPGFPRERNDDGGWVGCVGARGWCQGGRPALAGGRFANRPYDRGGRTRAGVMRGLLVVGGPPSTGSGRTDLGGARAVGSGGCDGGAFARWEVLVGGNKHDAHKQKTPAPGVSTCEPKGRGGSRSGGKILGSVKPSTSGGGIRRLGRMWSPGLGRRPIRSPRWRRRGRGRCRR